MAINIAASDRKIADGLEHLRLAEKCMKTSFFKWRPDLDGAATEYIKAATSFKNAKAYDEAKEAYYSAAHVQEQMNSPFHAGKSYEQAALICKENNELDKAADLMETAAVMFQEHGTPDTAALTLEKAAKMIEMEKPDRAVHLYKKACDVAEIEDRPRQCVESMGKAARLLIKQGRLNEAIDALKKEIDFNKQAENWPSLFKVVVGLILVHLHNEDYQAAQRVYESSFGYPGFSDSDDAEAMETLLKAYDKCDEETARSVLNLPLIKYMDNAFARLARDLPIPNGGLSSETWNMVAGGVTDSVPNEEEDSLR